MTNGNAPGSWTEHDPEHSQKQCTQRRGTGCAPARKIHRRAALLEDSPIREETMVVMLHGSPSAHQAQDADEDQVNGNDVIEEPGHQEDQNPGYESDQRLHGDVKCHRGPPFSNFPAPSQDAKGPWSFNEFNLVRSANKSFVRRALHPSCKNTQKR